MKNLSAIHQNIVDANINLIKGAKEMIEQRKEMIEKVLVSHFTDKGYIHDMPFKHNDVMVKQTGEFLLDKEYEALFVAVHRVKKNGEFYKAGYHSWIVADTIEAI